MRALAKNREERYGEWREFAAELEVLFGNLELPDQDLSEAERFSVLCQLPLFQGFGDVEIWEALRMGTWRRLRDGTTLIREGERCRSFFIVAAGQVAVSRGGQSLGTLGEGQLFGDILYFEDRNAPRETTIASASPVVLLEITAESLRRASAACQVQFDHALLRTLVKRMERLPHGGATAR
jgi:CRP-like cAMP-binding protein